MTQATAATSLPSWLKVTDHGMTVSLKYPSTVNGIVVDKLSVRSPSIKDARIAKELGGGDHAKEEIQLFANLAEAHADDIEALKERDYRRLQESYFRLVSEDEL